MTAEGGSPEQETVAQALEARVPNLHALGDDHVQSLRRVEHVIDDNYKRKTRRQALEALSLHGFDDHHAWLKNAESS